MAGPSVGMNLAGIEDWASGFPFLDHFKTSRQWLTDDWQPFRAGVLDIDENGWIRHFSKDGAPLDFIDDQGNHVAYSSVSTVVLTETGGLRPAGRYILDYEGEGRIGIDFGGATVVHRSPGRIVLDLADLPSDDTQLLRIVIESTDPHDTGDYIRNIRLYEAAHADLIEAGEVFLPEFVHKIEGFRALRFMDWQSTNVSDIRHWSDRTEPEDVRWTGHSNWGSPDPVYGAPVETMVRLANETGTDPWFCIPYLADETYVRKFVTYVRDTLDPGLVARFEYSNEAWNWLFDVSHWGVRQADKLWGDGDPRTDDVEGGWMQHYGMKAAWVANIVAEVFGDETGTRALNVFSTQAGWQGLESYALDAPDFVAAGGTAPREAPFHVYAIASYFGGSIGGADMAAQVADWIAMNRADPVNLPGLDAAIDWLRNGTSQADTLRNIGDMFRYHAGVANRLGWQFESYEGGQHIVDAGGLASGGGQQKQQTAFFTALTAHPEMQALYEEWFGIWRDSGGGLVAHFNDFGVPGPFGSWGVWDSPYDEADGPRAAAVARWRDAVEAWWDDPRSAAGFSRGIYDDGSAADELMRGTRLDDRLYALAGDDRLSGRAGNDLLHGGDGNDAVRGGAGADDLRGSSGADVLKGGTGRDVVTGGDGKDLISGGRGNDNLHGDAGSDIFVFRGGFGRDVIVDFDPGRAGERIDLSGVSAITGFADLRADHLFTVGDDTVIDDGAGNRIRLIGVQISDLAANDFVF